MYLIGGTTCFSTFRSECWPKWTFYRLILHRKTGIGHLQWGSRFRNLPGKGWQQVGTTSVDVRMALRQGIYLSN